MAKNKPRSTGKTKVRNARAAGNMRRKMSVPTGLPRRAFTARVQLEDYKNLRQRAVEMDCPLQLVIDTAIANYFRTTGKKDGRKKFQPAVDPLTTVTALERPLMLSALSLVRSRVVEARGLLVAFLEHWEHVVKGRRGLPRAA